MDHTEAATTQDTPPGADHDRDGRSERPDRRGPRGNQDVEEVDVERGQRKIERVLGW